MLRVTIELIPYGDENYARPLGIIEIANDGTGDVDNGNYIVALKKTPPWIGALRDVWRKGEFQDSPEIITGKVEGFSRTKRGVYDLLYKALVACGIDKRNKYA